MSKAVLVMDMQESCKKCRFHLNYPSVKHYCYIKQEAFEEEKPKWCPLKPLPEKREADSLYDSEYFEALGYNACIDEILKGATDEQKRDNGISQ